MFKVKFLGAMRRTGISKAGNNYDICKLFYAYPMESKNSDSNTFVAHGCEQRELELDPSAVGQFTGINVGEEIDLDMAPNPRNPSQNLVTGIL